MKLSIRAVCWALGALAIIAPGVRAEDATEEEDKVFWNRILHSYNHHHHNSPSFSAPPRQACRTDVTIQCRLASNGRDCRSFNPNGSDCVQTLLYDLEVCNVGSVDMRVNEALFQFNRVTTNMVDNLPTNPVRTGQCTSMSPRRVVDVCRNRSITAGFAVQANPPNGNMCQAEDRHTVNFPRPPPPPPPPVPAPVAQPTQSNACSIEVGANCVIGGNDELRGLPCSTPFSGQKVFDFSIGVFTQHGEPVRISNLVVETNFAGDFQLSSQVQGEVVQGQSVARATFSADINSQRQFNILLDVAGTRLSDGQICMGQQSLSFRSG